jgi:hypothetical protein
VATLHARAPLHARGELGNSILGWDFRIRPFLTARWVDVQFVASRKKDVQYQRVFDSRMPMPHGDLLGRLHAFKQPQLLGGKRQPSLIPYGSGAIQHQGFLRISRQECTLRRREAGGVKDPGSHLADLAGLPVVSTVILRQDHVVTHRP